MFDIKKQLRSIELEIDDILIEKDSKLYKKILKELTDALVNTFDNQRKLAINEAIDYLVNVNSIEFQQKHINKINNILESNLGADITKLVEESVLNLSEKMLKLGIKEVAQMVNLKLSFDTFDTNAAEILGNQSLFWIGNYYGEQLSKSIDDVLKSYFTGNMTIEQVATKFEVRFFELTDKGESYFEGLAEHSINRVREIGHVNGYEKAGIEYLEIVAVMDDRTSEVCQYMNGKIIPVANAVTLRDQLLSADSPEEIKDIAPWKSDGEIKDSDLPPGMSLPPYHFRCRTTTIAYFGNV